MSLTTHRTWAGPADRAHLHALLRARAQHLGPPTFPLASDCDYWLAITTNPRTPQEIELWFDDGGAGQSERVVAYAWPSHGDVDYMLHPDRADLLADLFAFAEAQTLAGPVADGVLKASRLSDNPAQKVLLEANGYHPTDDFVRHSAYDLRQPLPAMPALPAGYTVRGLAGPSEAPSRAACHQAAFTDWPMTTEMHERVMQSSLYRLDTDMVAVAPDGSIAAFALFWFDPVLGVGEIEPVGCHPEHQHQGLATACIVEGMRRLVALGAEWAVINSWRDDSPGSRLYAKMGFAEGRRHETWLKALPGDAAATPAADAAAIQEP